MQTTRSCRNLLWRDVLSFSWHWISNAAMVNSSKSSVHWKSSLWGSALSLSFSFRKSCYIVYFACNLIYEWWGRIVWLIRLSPIQRHAVFTEKNNFSQRRREEGRVIVRTFFTSASEKTKSYEPLQCRKVSSRKWTGQPCTEDFHRIVLPEQHGTYMFTGKLGHYNYREYFFIVLNFSFKCVHSCVLQI